MVIIYDRAGIGMANVDRKLITFNLQFVKILQDFYAERLSCFYVLGANFMYWAMYKTVSMFLAEKTKNKINLIDNNEDLK